MISFYKKILFTLSAIFIAFVLSAQITPQEAIQQMQKGINLGNTLNRQKKPGGTIPRAEEYYFDLYKEAGFDLCTYSCKMGWLYGKNSSLHC